MMADPKAVQTMKEKYGENYFREIAKRSSSRFKKGSDKAREAGRKGGQKSRRRK